MPEAWNEACPGCRAGGRASCLFQRPPQLADKGALAAGISLGLDGLIQIEDEARHLVAPVLMRHGLVRHARVALGLVQDGTLGGEREAIIELRQVDAAPVKAVDTLGAGDLFAGAYLYALCREQGHVRAAELANRAAGQLVTHFGPRLPQEALRELLD